MDITQYAVYGIPAIALVIGLVKVAREVGLSSKYAPVASVGLGVVAGVVMANQNGDPIIAGVVTGIAVGLMACGVYDVGKKTSEA